MPLLAPSCSVALAVRLDSPGPILFTQQRTGQHGIRFGMYKFRTMVRDAEALKASLMHLNILPPPDFKIIDDPRITRVGKFLRKTSLDELPQIFNVLRGEMSLVGPRPTSFAASTYDLWHTERLEAVPGITGLWQVKERNAATFDERLRLDVEYLERMSLGLDLKIMWWTVVSVCEGPAPDQMTFTPVDRERPRATDPARGRSPHPRRLVLVRSSRRGPVVVGAAVGDLGDVGPTSGTPVGRPPAPSPRASSGATTASGGRACGTRRLPHFHIFGSTS